MELSLLPPVLCRVFFSPLEKQLNALYNIFRQDLTREVNGVAKQEAKPFERDSDESLQNP